MWLDTRSCDCVGSLVLCRWGLYVPTGLWGAIFVLDVLKLNIQWLVVVIAALALNLANVVGYTKCSNDAKARMAKLMDQGSAGFSLMQSFSQSSAFQSAMRGLFGSSDAPASSASSSAHAHELTVDRTVRSARVPYAIGGAMSCVSYRPATQTALPLSLKLTRVLGNP